MLREAADGFLNGRLDGGAQQGIGTAVEDEGRGGDHVSRPARAAAGEQDAGASPDGDGSLSHAAYGHFFPHLVSPPTRHGRPTSEMGRSDVYTGW